MAAFQESDVVKDATSLARQALTLTLTKSERVHVRNTMYTAIMLDQIKRAGDINCVMHTQALALIRQWEADGCPRDKEYQMMVYGAKKVKAGVPTIINVHPVLFDLFKYYSLSVRPQFWNNQTSDNWILSESSESRLKPGSVTKAYRKPGRYLPLKSARTYRNCSRVATARSSWKQLRMKLTPSNPHLYSKKGV